MSVEVALYRRLRDGGFKVLAAPAPVDTHPPFITPRRDRHEREQTLDGVLGKAVVPFQVVCWGGPDFDATLDMVQQVKLLLQGWTSLPDVEHVFIDGEFLVFDSGGTDQRGQLLQVRLAEGKQP